MSLSVALSSNQPLLRHLDTIGDGTGLIHATGNYSGAGAQGFSIRPAVGQVFHLHEFHFMVADAGGLSINGYGSGAALAVGVKIAAYDRDGNIIFDMTAHDPVMINNEWISLGFDIQEISWSGNPRTLRGNLATKDFGTPFSLDGSKGHYMEAVMNDDFTGLLDQTFVVKGFEAEG